MTVFKAFLHVLNKSKAPIIMYTAILVFFGAFNMQTSDNNASFTPSKPDVLIVNNDEEKGLTKGLVDYLAKKTNIMDIDSGKIDDALFYRDVNYVIYIPKGFNSEFLKGNNPEIEIKSTGDYQSSLADMMVQRYLKVANIYKNIFDNEEEIVARTNETLAKETNLEMTSKLNTTNLEKAAFYYSFTNYSILAGSVYVICLILSSFKEEKIHKRTIISSMDYKKHNRILLLSNSLLAIILWLFYVILSFILIGDIMFTSHGFIYILNSFVFTICALTIAFLIGTLVNNKDAINGIVIVVSLGSSFLCGAFVPMQWLPTSVLNMAHVLPSYYFIKNNELIKTLEVVDFTSLKPILINMGIILVFAIIFIIITNIISKKKRKIA